MYPGIAYRNKIKNNNDITVPPYPPSDDYLPKPNSYGSVSQYPQSSYTAPNTMNTGYYQSPTGYPSYPPYSNYNTTTPPTNYPYPPSNTGFPASPNNNYKSYPYPPSGNNTTSNGSYTYSPSTSNYASPPNTGYFPFANIATTQPRPNTTATYPYPYYQSTQTQPGFISPISPLPQQQQQPYMLSTPPPLPQQQQQPFMPSTTQFPSTYYPQNTAISRQATMTMPGTTPQQNNIDDDIPPPYTEFDESQNLTNMPQPPLSYTNPPLNNTNNIGFNSNILNNNPISSIPQTSSTLPNNSFLRNNI